MAVSLRRIAVSGSKYSHTTLLPLNTRSLLMNIIVYNIDIVMLCAQERYLLHRYSHPPLLYTEVFLMLSHDSKFTTNSDNVQYIYISWVLWQEVQHVCCSSCRQEKVCFCTLLWYRWHSRDQSTLPGTSETLLGLAHRDRFTKKLCP